MVAYEYAKVRRLYADLGLPRPHRDRVLRRRATRSTARGRSRSSTVTWLVPLTERDATLSRHPHVQRRRASTGRGSRRTGSRRARGSRPHLPPQPPCTMVWKSHRPSCLTSRSASRRRWSVADGVHGVCDHDGQLRVRKWGVRSIPGHAGRPPAGALGAHRGGHPADVLLARPLPGGAIALGVVGGQVEGKRAMSAMASTSPRWRARRSGRTRRRSRPGRLRWGRTRLPRSASLPRGPPCC